MSSSRPGTGTSAAEVLNISAHGIWVLVRGREYFLDHEKFPWFKEATVGDILNVDLLHDSHLHWPTLDVDLELECLENPDEYPLIFH